MGQKLFQYKAIGWRKLLLVFCIIVVASFTRGKPDVLAEITDTVVGGPIISNTTWTLANSPYIVNTSIDIQPGVVLTIEPGVKVKFNAGTKMQVNGELIARGTVTGPVTFTSSKVNPIPGDWGNIEFTSTAITTTMDTAGAYISGSILQYCVVEYAGASAQRAISAQSLLIDNCTIRNNNSGGVYDIGSSGASSRLSNSYIHHNTRDYASGDGVGAWMEYGAAVSNTIANNSTTFSETSLVGAYGIGLYLKNGVAISNTIIRNSSNRTDSGGRGVGIYAFNSIVEGNTVTQNSSRSDSMAYSYGAGIMAENSSVNGNIVNYNSALDRDSANTNFVTQGGGIYATFVSSVLPATVDGNIVNENAIAGRETAQGGGIYVEFDPSAAPATVNNNVIVGNSVVSQPIWVTEGGGLYISGGTASNNIISGNTITSTWFSNIGVCLSGVNGGGIAARDSGIISNVVNNNTIINSAANGGTRNHGGGIDASNSFVFQSVVSGNSIVTMNSSCESLGGGISVYNHVAVYSSTVSSNSVSESTDQGAGTYINGTGEFESNVVVGNVGPPGSPIGGIGIEGTPEVHYNTLYGNAPYDVAIVSSGDVSGTNNYWGTTINANILQQVYDWYDNANLGKMLYIPYLQNPDPQSAIAPPIQLPLKISSSSVILSWLIQPSFTTGWGYKVYYDSDSLLPPYGGTGLTQGNSPIDAGNQTTYTLSGLDPNADCYFAVTVYDNQGHESWYSNIQKKPGGYKVYLPTVRKG